MAAKKSPSRGSRGRTDKVKFDLVDVLRVRVVGPFRLHVSFSDGSSGEMDFSSRFKGTGPMVQPLKDPAYFAKVFIEMGALTWPNGYDWDPIALHMDMRNAGVLSARSAAAE
jgi:hypothetical protein